MAIIELDQFHISKCSAFYRGIFKIEYGYYPKREARERKKGGEDYLLYKVEGKSLVFALCDGVGQSFYGGIAAQIVGESLIDYLSRASTGLIHKNIHQLETGITKFLNEQKEPAKHLINKKYDALGDHVKIPAIDILKNKAGTQTNLICGIIKAPNEVFQHGLIQLLWMGDANLKVYQKKQDTSINIIDTKKSKGGWSSVDGIMGEIKVHESNLDESETIIAFSDGCDPFRDEITPQTEPTKIDIYADEAQAIKDDDVSLIRISWNTGLELLDTEDVGLEFRSYLLKRGRLNQRPYPSSEKNKKNSSEEPEQKSPLRRRMVKVLGGFAILALIWVSGFALGSYFSDIPSRTEPGPPNELIDTLIPTASPLDSTPLPTSRFLEGVPTVLSTGTVESEFIITEQVRCPPSWDLQKCGK